MKTYIAYCIAILSTLFLSTTLAHAQGTVTSTLKQVAPDDSNASLPVLFVYPSAPSQNGPACATDTLRFVVDATENPAMVAAMLTAFATGATVSIVGTGTCSVWNSVETLRYAIITSS